MKVSQPEVWEDAVAFDHEIRQAVQRKGWEGAEVYLHDTLVPLDEVDLRSAEDMGQANLFGNECEGLCGI